jgi:hypothetical protein
LGLWNAPTPAAVPVMTAVPAGVVVPVRKLCLLQYSRPDKQMNDVCELTSTHVAENLAWGEDHVLRDLDILHHFAIDSGKEPPA